MASIGWGTPSNTLDKHLNIKPQPTIPLAEPPPKEEPIEDVVGRHQQEMRLRAYDSMSDDELLQRYQSAKAAQDNLTEKFANVSDEDLLRQYQEAKASLLSSNPQEPKEAMGGFEYLRKRWEADGVNFTGPEWKKNLDATLMALTPFMGKITRIDAANSLGNIIGIAKGEFDINDRFIQDRFHDQLLAYRSGLEDPETAKKRVQSEAMRQAIAMAESRQAIQNEISERGTTTMGTIFGKGSEIVGQAGEALVPGGLATKALVSGTTEAAARYAEHANSKIGYDENGNPVILDGDSTGKAIREALEGGGKTGAIEFFGGKVLGKVWGATGGKLVGKAAGSALGQKVAENGIVKGITKITNWLKAPLEALGWAGIPGEVGEEFLDGATDAYFGLDTTDAEERGTTAGGRFKKFAGDFFKGENLADLAGSMLLMQAIGGGSAYLQKRHTNKQLNKIITEEIGGVSENVLNKLSPEEKARIIEAHYQGLSAEEAADIINKGAGVLDKFMIEKQTEATKSADGRAMLAEMNPEAADAIRAARREGKDISRKMIRDLGLSEKVLGDVESRNKFGDALLGDDRKLAAKNAAKMDGQQEMALRQEIAGFVGDTAEAQRVYDRVTMKLKDASVLDDPYQREKLVMQAAEAVWNEDQSQRIGGARQKARMAEKADHEARLAEAEARADEQAQRAENDAQERTNAEMLARETKRYDDFMLAREEARAKGGQNETRTDEEHPEPEQAPRVTPPAGEAALPMEAGKAPSEVGGEVAEEAYAPSTERDSKVIQGTDRTVGEAKKLLREDVDAKIADAINELGVDIKVKGIELHGSRVRGDAKDDSDLDLVVEYSGDVKEDVLFEILNENSTDFNGIKVDINPINTEKTGSLKEYMARSEQYDAEKSAEAPTSASTETRTNTPPTTAKSAEGGSQAADAVSTPTKPKTVKEGKDFVNSNIGKRYTDGKKTYEITGLTKEGEVSFTITDKKGNAEENSLPLSGAMMNIFGTKKKSAVWSEVKTPETEKNSQNRTKTTAKTPKTEQNVPKAENKSVEATAKRQTHDESAEEVVANAKKTGQKLSELGELRPPTPKIGSMPGRVAPLKKVDEKAAVSALKNVASQDKVRPHLHRVHVENGEMVATDGRILLFGKAPKGMKDGEYTTTPIGQKRVDDLYPRWKQVVPDIKRGGYKKVGIIANGDISTDSVAYAGRLNKRFHKEQKKDSPRAQVSIGEQNYSPELLKNLTDAMFRLGVKDITVYQGKSIMSPMVLKGRNVDGEITGVIMPLRLADDVDVATTTHVRLFGKQEATTTKTPAPTISKPVDAEPKTAPKSEPKAETKTQIGDDLSKLSEEELKRRIDEVDESLEPDDYKKAMKPLKDELAKRKGNGGENFSDKAIVDRAFGDFTDENGNPKSATELIDRGWRFVKSKVGAAYRYRLEKDGVGYHDLSSKKIRSKMPPVNYEENLKFLEEYSNRADAKVEPKSEAAPTITPAEAMKKLGSLGAADVDTLTKAMHREERLGHTERANMIRVLRDYKRGVGTNENPQSDETSGGKYRASVEAAKPLDDPAFVAWAKKRGVAPTTQMRNEYDKAMADMLTNRLSRWIKGVSVKWVNFIAPEEGGDVRPIHDGERIVGSYNRATGEVKLAKGASVETVLHELGWHAARHWAEVNADSDPKAANLLNQMKEYAESAPEDVKKAVRDTYGEMSADTLLDEIGAARFTKEQSGKIAKALATKEGAAWYKKIGDKVKEFFKNFLTKIGYNRVDLDGVENMSPDVFGDFLADVMMSGKQLGERTAFSMEAPKGLLARWTTSHSDYKAPVAELEKRTTGSSNNIYYLARTLEGMAQRGKNRAERAIKRVKKILGEDISLKLLAQYMQLKAYEERNAKIERRNGKADASGMTPEDARAIEKTIKDSGVDEAIFEEAAQILWDLQKEGLQARVDAGLLDQETANKWMTDEPHHIPWRDAIDPDSGEYVGRRMGASEFDTAEGRKTAASGDPITWMLQEYQDAMTRAAQNRLRSSIANLTRLNGDVGIIYDGIQTDSKGKRSFIKYPKKGSHGTAKVLSIPEGVKIESTVKNDGGMKNVLTFKEGGETKYLVLNGTLGEAVAGAVTGRTLARPPAWISWTMRGYAATATSLSPAFAVRNITADNFDIHNNLVAKYGWVKGEKMFAKIVKEQFLMTKQLGSYIKNGDFKLDKDGKITDFQKLVEAYEDAGGLIGGMATEGYDATVKKIQADFRAGRNKARSIGKSVATYWTMMQRMSELAPRLAVFKTAMESGMSAKEAAMLSRDITVDFNKKGAKTPWFNTLWMFSNSALGANLTQVKHLATKGGLKLAGGLVMYGFAEGMLEALMNGDDDEREKEGLASGKDINEYTRQNSLYIRRGDKVFRVNIHMGPFAYAKYFGNVMARTFSGMISPEKAAKELGLTAAEVAASFTGLGNVSGDALVQTAVPTVLQPFVQMATNKDYAGRAVYRTKFTESKPDSAHGRKSTPEFYQNVASFLNEITGGNEARKGVIDIAPETVKMLTEMVGKNFAKDIMEISETGYKLLSGNAKDLDVRNVPFAGDVVRKQEGNDNRFYENYNRYRDDKYELKNRSDLKGDERRAYLKEHPWLYSAGKPGVTRIDNIVKRIEKLRDVEESDRATDERKAEAKATRRKLQARVIEIMKGK